MIRYRLGVEDLADTRFAVSPLQETALSLWAVSDQDRLDLPRRWLQALLADVEPADAAELSRLVGPSFALPDFLTPRPERFAPRFEDELGVLRRTPVATVARDLEAAHRPAPPPPVELGAICDGLERLWHAAIEPRWPELRSLLESDTAYRAHRLRVGGARSLFADLHPNVRWADGTLSIDDMIGHHDAEADGRGLTLVPSVFAHKPVPPVDAARPPWLAYPARGTGALGAPEVNRAPAALHRLLGAPRAGILAMLDTPLHTAELARRLHVTPSAVSQHLRVLRAGGLLERERSGRTVLYRRSPLGDQLVRAA